MEQNPQGHSLGGLAIYLWTLSDFFVAFLGWFSSPGLLSWDLCNFGLSSVGVGEVGRCCEGTQQVYSGGGSFAAAPH